MNISVKESLEHICEVFNYFGISYITAELIRRGKNEKNLRKRKDVIIKYCYLINDLCLLYCFEFKRKFKSNYEDFMRKEFAKSEEQFMNREGRGKKRENKLIEGEEEEDGEEKYKFDKDSSMHDEEECYQEELDEDINYFDDFYIISPLVVLILEYFEYPRLYHLLKCNFQMAKELLLCIGFLIDSIKLFEHFDKEQPYYEELFSYIDPAESTGTVSKYASKTNPKRDEKKPEEYGLHYFINEAMLFMSNRPFDIEIFECKYFYNFLEKMKNNSLERGGTLLLRPLENKTSESSRVGLKGRRRNESDLMEDDDIFKNEDIEGTGEEEEETQEHFSLRKYVAYDYSKYQDNFISFYNKRKLNESEEYQFEDETNSVLYIMEITQNVNKNCSKLIQMQRKMEILMNELQNHDKDRLMLFHKFNELLKKFTHPHNITIHVNNSKELYKIDKQGEKSKSIDLNDNMLFSVVIEDKGMEQIEQRNIKNQMSEGMTSRNNQKGNVAKGKDSEIFEKINYDLLADPINLTEFYILNKSTLYNKLIHIYKNGVPFFHYEKLRAVFWIWLQSLFSDFESEEEQDITTPNEIEEPISFYDINVNKFFYDNVTYSEGENSQLHLHVLSDLNDFERNFRLIKEYLMNKGCTAGYSKGSTMDKKIDLSKLDITTKYVQKLHSEFDAFYNYRKKAGTLNDEVFIEFLEDKKKNMVIDSKVEKEDYSNLAMIVHKHLIPLDKIIKYNPILNLSQIVEGIKQQNHIKTTIDINQIAMKDWNSLYGYHKKQKELSRNSGNKGIETHLGEKHIIHLTNNSKYRIDEKPITYATSIFNYTDHFITNNDVYSFSENVFQKNEEFTKFVKSKQNKCIHNFYHILYTVEKYMNCIAYNI